MGTTYNTSIDTGGFGANIPGRIEGLRTSQPKPLLHEMFNMPVYMKNRVNPQQSAEMTRQIGDQHRSTSANMANDLEREFGAANQQMRFNQIGAASQQANNFYGTNNRVAAFNRGQYDPMQILSQLFGGDF